MTTAITRFQPTTLDDIQRTASLMVASGYFEQSKGASDKIALARIATSIMAGQEMGYTPFVSVQGIHIIQGKPVIGANLMAAAIKAHPKYDYRIRQLDNDACRIEFFQGDESLGIESFTMEDAKAAGLVGKDNWKKYPRNMLFARCISNGVRFRTPDIFSGAAAYTPDEFDMPVDEEGNAIVVVDVEPEPTMYQNGNGHAEEPAPQLASEDCRKAFHASGVQVYGKDAWEKKRHELVKAITHGRTESSNDLTQEECQKLIDGIKVKADTN